MTSWPSSYLDLPDIETRVGNHLLRPIAWEDREPIRLWRNNQIHVLRQSKPLTVSDQDRYFSDVVRPQMTLPQPPQILWGLLEDDHLIGYGGLVHIQWADSRGEVSFLTNPARLDSQTFASDWRTFLDMLTAIASSRLGFHKLTTETYEIRQDVIDILESAGFQREGIHPEHHRIGDRWVASLSHGLLLD